MEITQLDSHFEITQYQLRGRTARLQLADGIITVQALYTFHNTVGTQVGTITALNMAVTPEQSDDLKAILADVLSATNTEIETQTGWTQLVEEPEP